MTKDEARAVQKKRILEINHQIEREEKIRQNLLQKLGSCKHVIGYRADKWEVNLDSLWSHPDLKNTSFYFPRVVSKEERILEFVLPLQWESGAFGIIEPKGKELISPSQADLSIIPALGFNERGFRLGRGAGFYDRAFAGIESKKMIGITFSEFFSIDFPSSDYDIRVGGLVTELGFLFF